MEHAPKSSPGFGSAVRWGDSPTSGGTIEIAPTDAAATGMLSSCRRGSPAVIWLVMSPSRRRRVVIGANFVADSQLVPLRKRRSRCSCASASNSIGPGMGTKSTGDRDDSTTGWGELASGERLMSVRS